MSLMKKNGFTKRSSQIIQYGTILSQLLKVLLFMLANLSKFINYCTYLSLLVDNSDDKIYNRQIDILGAGKIFKSSVAGPTTSKAEPENTKSARCKICLKEESIKKNLMVKTRNVFDRETQQHNFLLSSHFY